MSFSQVLNSQTIFNDGRVNGVITTGTVILPNPKAPGNQGSPGTRPTTSGQLSIDQILAQLGVSDNNGDVSNVQPDMSTSNGNISTGLPPKGTNNIILGNNSGTSLTFPSSSDLIIGHFGLGQGTAVSNTISLGNNSGQNISTGSDNVNIGSNTSGPSSSTNNTLIGSGSSVVGNITNATAIGAGTSVLTSDTIQVGRNGIDNVIVGNDLTIPGNLNTSTINNLEPPSSAVFLPVCTFSTGTGTLTTLGGSYQRIGDIVRGFFVVNYVLNPGTTDGSFQFTLPISPFSVFSNFNQLNAVPSFNLSLSQASPPEIVSFPTTNQAVYLLTFTANTGATGNVSVEYAYILS